MASSVASCWIKWVDNTDEYWMNVGSAQDNQQQKIQVCQIFRVELTDGVFDTILREMAQLLHIPALPPTMTIGWIGTIPSPP